MKNRNLILFVISFTIILLTINESNAILIPLLKADSDMSQSQLFKVIFFTDLKDLFLRYFRTLNFEYENAETWYLR